MRRIDSRMPCRMRTQAVQQGRSERRGESVLTPDGEPLRDASTPPADVFRILLRVFRCVLPSRGVWLSRPVCADVGIGTRG